MRRPVTPLAHGGLGLRSAERSRVAAHWASWADTMPMIQERHPAVAELIIGSLQGGPNSPCLVAVQNAALELDGEEGFEVPEWTALAGESGLAARAVRERVGSTKQPDGSNAEHILPHLTPTRRAMLRSQSGPVAGIPFSVAPSSFLTRLEPALSGSCFSGASPCLCPCPNAAVGVAVSLTPLAATVQLALGQEFWAGEGSLWRVRLQGVHGSWWARGNQPPRARHGPRVAQCS